MTAERFIYVRLTKYYKLVIFGKPVRMIRRASAFYADGMNLLDLFSDCHECRHRAKGLS
jgi:hypothetical protein